MISTQLKEKYHIAPAAPGVYLMKGEQDEILYVGKALNLKKRLSSYFVKEGGHDLKTGILIGKIADFETIVTATEHEALILESNLIKTHRPRYNVLLKDGKNYPLIRIDIKQDYPALEVVRKIKGDGALYFGPYSSPGSIRSTIKTVNKIFRLRKCKGVQFKNRTRPCLNFQIKACLGVCCHAVPREDYHRVVQDVVLFLKGRAPELIKKLKQEMAENAEALEYEKAAQVRDTLLAIEKILERQVVVTPDMKDRDVLACVKQEGRAMVTLLFVRSGYLVGTRYEAFDLGVNTRSEVLEAFVRHYYETAPLIPARILLSDTIENLDIIAEHLTEIRGKKVGLHVPMRGEKRRLVEMAVVNGRTRLKNEMSREAEKLKLLGMLQRLMTMDRLPLRMECFDNSHLAGTDPVSAMVVFTNGVPDKGAYRKFILKDTRACDDYGAMTEVLTRRFKNQETPLPDLLVVDGGKGQLSMAVAVLKDIGLTGRFCVAGLAKRDSDRGEEEDKIYLPGRANPLNTSQSMKALYLLQQIRDESHRFAITFQRKRRTNRASTSVLDSIPGIGKKRKEVLLNHFKGLSRMKQAKVEELAALPGMTQKSAQEVVQALNNSITNQPT